MKWIAEPLWQNAAQIYHGIKDDASGLSAVQMYLGNKNVPFGTADGLSSVTHIQIQFYVVLSFDQSGEHWQLFPRIYLNCSLWLTGRIAKLWT